MDSEVEVAGHKLNIKKVIAEGGTAFVYVAQDSVSNTEYALKRLIGADKQACNAIINEISIHKQVSGHPNILHFTGAAFIDKTSQPQQHAEYLLLTELCKGGSLAEYISENLEPQVVLRIFYQAACAVAHMHNQIPAITHRDIKIENFLIGNDNQLKLCDFGSATKQTFAPDFNWNAQQRNALEDQLSSVTTPMYRAPEMLDTWSNYEINCKVDIWALGCILFMLCFKKHPFEDSAKLRIINGNYVIPTSTRFECFHEIIKGCLIVNPAQRFSISMILDRLAAIAETHNWILKGKLELQHNVTVDSLNEYLKNNQQRLRNSATPATENNQQNDNLNEIHQPPKNTSTNNIPTNTNMSLFTSLRDGAGNFLRNLKDTSSKVMQTVQQSIARADLDVSYITSRVLVMPIPSEGFESAYKTNNIEDVRLYVESRFVLQKVSVYNFGSRSVRLPPPVRTVDVGSINKSYVPSLQRVFSLTEDMYGFLNADPKSIIIIQTNDSCVAAIFVCALLMYADLICEPEDAIQVYAVKRHPINLRPSEFRYLYYLGDILRTTPLLPHSRSVNLISLCCQPVPRMTKSRDGCRFYVEVYANEHLLLTTLDDYEKMRLYTVGSSKIVIPINIAVCGDLNVVLYHARNSIKGTQAVKICQFQIFTGFIPEQETLISFGINDLDDLPEVELVSKDFNVSLSISVAEKDSLPAIKQNWLRDKQPRNSFNLFSSQLELEEMVDNFVTKPTQKPNFKSSSIMSPVMQDDIPSKKSTLILPDVTEIGHESITTANHEPSPPIDLLNLNQPILKNVQGLPTTELKTCDASYDLLGAFGDDVSSGIGSTSIPDILDNAQSCETTKLDDIFGSLASNTTFVLDEPIKSFKQSESIPKPTQQANVFDKGLSSHMADKTEHLFGDINNLASKLNMNVGKSKDYTQNNTPVSGNSSTEANRSNNIFVQTPPNITLQSSATSTAQSIPTRPDYNRSHFEPQKNPIPSTTKNTDIFADILGEQGYKFGQKSNHGPRSINEMRKEDLIKDMDPDRVKIMEWTEGKKNNIRALLCSMDLILWNDAKWNKCEMSALISRSDVKKAYRRACLAVHPDKHTGTENENVAKLIFMELNNAWTDFENDTTLP